MRELAQKGGSADDEVQAVDSGRDGHLGVLHCAPNIWNQGLVQVCGLMEQGRRTGKDLGLNQTLAVEQKQDMGEDFNLKAKLADGFAVCAGLG